jgi:hypothetical protein
MRLRLNERNSNRVFRSIFKVTLGVAGALVLTALALAAVGAPPWLLRMIGLTLFLAFPFVLVLSWALSSEPAQGARPKPWDIRP